MNQINLQTIDLNLLRILLALAETGSVSLAAGQLGMSQPATSSALGRLRHATGDALFSRTKSGMVPTPYVDAILPDIRHHMNGILQSLEPQNTFDPKTSETIFRLSLSGVGEMIFIPPLLDRLWNEAPAVKLSNTPVPPTELSNGLRDNKLDCAIGMIEARGQGLLSHDLFADDFVFVAGEGLNTEPETLKDLKAHQIVVSRPEASYAADIERHLLRHGFEQSISVRLGHFGAIAPLISRHPVVAVMPRQLANQYAAQKKARILPIHLKQPQQIVRLIWHERTDVTQLSDASKRDDAAAPLGPRHPLFQQ